MGLTCAGVQLKMVRRLLSLGITKAARQLLAAAAAPVHRQATGCSQGDVEPAVCSWREGSSGPAPQPPHHCGGLGQVSSHGNEVLAVKLLQRDSRQHVQRHVWHCCCQHVPRRNRNRAPGPYRPPPPKGAAPGHAKRSGATRIKRAAVWVRWLERTGFLWNRLYRDLLLALRQLCCGSLLPLRAVLYSTGISFCFLSF